VPEVDTRLEDAMTTATYTVPGISCNHCKHAIEGEVAQVTGVSSVEVNVEAKTVTVVAEPLDEQAIVHAIDEAGYEVAA
jgi:copper chaperone